MDFNSLAELLFGDIKTTPEDIIAKYPNRNLDENAAVTRFAPSPTGYMHIGGLYATLISQKIAKQSGGLACVFAGEDGQYAYAIVQAQAQDISAKVKDMNKALNGRGGGRNGFAQGSVQADRAAIEAFFGL